MESMKKLSEKVAQLIQLTMELWTPVQDCLCASANVEVGKF